MAGTRKLIGPRLAGFIGGALALALVLLQPTLMEVARNRVFDEFQRLAPRHNENWPARVVEIDEASLAKYGQWPWPRWRLANLVDRLGDAGAAAVLLDIVLAEPDRTSPPNVAASWVSSPALLPAEEALQGANLLLVDHDRRLAAALARTPSVLNLTASANAAEGGCLPPLPNSKVSGMTAAALARVAPSFRQTVSSLPILRQAASGEGFARVALKEDAVVRSAPLIALACDGTQIYPSFALEALRVAAPKLDAKFAPPAFVEAAKKGECHNNVTGVAGESVAEVHLCGLHIPTAEDGEIWIHYSPPSSVAKRRLSAIDAFEDDPEKLKAEVAGRIVLIGASAEGLEDVQITPMGDNRPGAHIHAEIIEQVLSGQTLYRAWDWMGAAEIAGGVIGALLLIIMLPSMSAAAGTVLWAGLTAALFGGAFYTFKDYNILINPVSPGLILSLSYFGAFVVLFQQEQNARRFIRGVFGKFLSPLVVERLEKDPSLLNLEGESREITAFFSDIRSFTTISEQLTPQQVTMMLNQYFTPMTRIVTENKGLVDKYIGDGLAAMWNAPLDIDNHPSHACRAALA
ncbi:MAG TPA: adenylate/guanylate cyclase domain-containing protein, partial [Parvularculaceae bacterium]|nr:adenylate/guanylate cyclase domain-containing protein [Parvularculaceae bacterium]